jgi:hypothetical protein
VVVEFYNTSFHSSLRRSPFEALYGRQSLVLGIQPPGAAHGKMDECLLECTNMDHLIQDHLICAQAQMKKQVDKHRSEREFSVGTMVYL